MALLPLFGTKATPYKAQQWRAVNDSIRGGSSTSLLAIEADGTRATFAGNLDTKTLGGAGFASQAHGYDPPLSLPSSRYSGLQLVLPSIKEDDTKEKNRCTSFTLNLKTSPAEERDDGRLESRITFEYHFDREDEEERVLDVAWSGFAPYYRGRPKENARLDPSKITEIAIMCRSNFDQQHGPFSLVLGQLSATPLPPTLLRRLLSKLQEALSFILGTVRAKL